MLKRLVIVFILWAGGHITHAQLLNDDGNLPDFAQEVFDIPSHNTNYTDLWDTQLTYLFSPLDLNTATRTDLRNLLLLTDEQIDSLLVYRTNLGLLLSIYELQAVPAWDVETINKVLPYIRVNERQAGQSLWQRIRSEPNNSLLVKTAALLQQQEGYVPRPTGSGVTSAYAGSPVYMLARYRVAHSNDFSLGFTLEKDAGERLTYNLRNRQYVFDYASAHMFLQNRGRWKQIALGDYRMQFGQGLVQGNGFNVGGGAEAVYTLRRNGYGLKPYTSVLEGGFNRGVAATRSMGNLDVSVYLSRNRVDGSSPQTDSTLADYNTISSIRLNGYHRTVGELATRQNTIMQTAGGAARYAALQNRLHLGALAQYTQLSAALQPADALYNANAFTGKRLANASLSVDYSYKNISFFSEVAASSNKALAGNAGIISALNRHFDIVISLRNYAAGFHSLNGNAYAQNTRAANERGVYYGFKYRFATFTIDAYADIYNFPQPGYKSNFPLNGRQLMGRLGYKPNRVNEIRFMVRSQYQTTGTDAPQGSRMYYWLSASYGIAPGIRATSRAQVNTYASNSVYSSGLSFTQDVVYKYSYRLSLTGRISIFNTTDNLTPQYLYEYDVAGSFSIPRLYGQGTRLWAMASYQLRKGTAVWVKYATTTWRGGVPFTGNEAVNGNTLNQIILQVRQQF